ncbi:hypothetical protein F441_21626 [Phytophthora nicotianae CJ01A1]|uniref:Uncharacterized protein n=6 Tax=Phytophthora nicotianae TaxID=4792 RepID=W2QUZ6_PHYN3|nr:hypothetical protein PPTG_21893 [Phytophthora nicotianae INRA-310]ETI31255.1 hypothetical protein F443_21738 [Phytophthora nicotianae P1569]ETK71668.1 hypothetical protein L915_21137 [Phytophthora nicotianae]ETO59987.1 hypothetical protein F444_21767 [Phytophthora nicotianae P1976]ETP01087.1 hypothetical protein F441_21626 [Phytophthora nicotianae CJ01A1]ETP29232.1 hypothetical protein F442_21600 [Phytophthora nicotianae P10297]
MIRAMWSDCRSSTLCLQLLTVLSDSDLQPFVAAAQENYLDQETYAASSAGLWLMSECLIQNLLVLPVSTRDDHCLPVQHVCIHLTTREITLPETMNDNFQ